MEGLFGLANAYHIKKDYKQAVMTYRDILELDKDYAKAYYNLGSLYAYYLVDPDTMSHYWNKFIELSSDQEEQAYLRGELERLGGTLK
jgi:tetratricopeptide (TPR) repeat protein